MLVTNLPLLEIFNHPTVSGLAAVLANKIEEDDPQATVIKPRTLSGDPVLSFAQQRMWFLNQLDPNSTVYNVSIVRRLWEPLDKDALQTSLNELAKRHESLRSTFATVDDKPQLIIHPHLDITIEWTETSDLKSTLTELNDRLFDLVEGPLVRLDMIKDSDGSYVMLMTMHHIITDARSFEIVWQEFTTNYQAIIDGNKLPLGMALQLQYADYAEWQRGVIEQSNNEQLEYWKQELSGAPELLELPTDRPRPAHQSYSGNLSHSIIDADTADKLRGFAASEGSTIFMVLLAAFQALMARYSGTSDIPVREMLVTNLPLLEIFNHPTVSGLAAVLANKIEEDDPQATVIKPHTLSGDPVLSFAQQRMWFLNQLDPNSTVYNVSIVRRLWEPLDKDALQTSLNELAKRHESLRSTFATVDDKPQLIIHPQECHSSQSSVPSMLGRQPAIP